MKENEELEEGLEEGGLGVGPNLLPFLVFLVAALFLIASAIFFIKGQLTISRCSESTMGVVLKNKYIRKRPVNRRPISIYCPIVTYTVDDVTYTELFGSGQMPAKYNKGDVVTVHYNPDNPQEFITDKGLGDDATIIIVFFCVGIAMILLGFLSLSFVAGLKRALAQNTPDGY